MPPIVLLNMKVVGEQTIFTIRADGPQGLVERDGNVQLFIDGLTEDGFNMMVNENHRV
jgi:hypothetical protein